MSEVEAPRKEWTISDILEEVAKAQGEPSVVQMTVRQYRYITGKPNAYRSVPDNYILTFVLRGDEYVLYDGKDKTG